MAYKHHGVKLDKAVLQPGSKFSGKRSGFDTGRRVYKVDINKFRAPLIGEPDFRYRQMYVSAIEILEDDLDIITYEVLFEGILNGGGKRGFKAVDRVVDSSRKEVQITGGVDVSVGVIVSDTYVTERYPDFSRLKTKTAPSNFQGRVPGNGEWLLQGISVRQAGPLYEVREEYEYRDPEPATITVTTTTTT